MSPDALANVSASGFVCVSSAVFAATYHRQAPWRSTMLGWHLMILAGAIGALGAYTVIVTLRPGGLLALVLRWGRTGLLLVLGILMLRLARVVVQRQRGHGPPDPPT